jgi:hypothetical protein
LVGPNSAFLQEFEVKLGQKDDFDLFFCESEFSLGFSQVNQKRE